MKKTLRILVCTALLTVGVQTATLAADHGTISVKGYATSQYIANEVQVLVTSKVEKSTLSEAKAESDRIGQLFSQSLVSLSVPDKNIFTQNYSVKEQKYPIKDTGTFRTMYIVTNTWKITTADKNKASQIIDQAASLGISDVRISALDLNKNDKEALHQKLLLQAATDARKKADALAVALGTRVVGVDSFYEDNYNLYPQYKLASVAEDKNTAPPASPTIANGEQTTDVRVNVVFRVK